MQCCPGWSNLGCCTQRAEGDDPTIIEGDHNIEKEIHVSLPGASTSWNACHQLGHSPERRPNIRCCIALVRGQEEDLSKDTPGGACFQWRRLNGVKESSEFHDSPECPLPMLHAQKGEWGSTTLHCGAKGTSDCHFELVSSEMQDTKAMTVPCPYYKNAFGGQEWSTRWDNLLGPAHAVSNMRVVSLRPLYAPLWLLLPWISCMLTSQALRLCWSQPNHLELPISWFSKTTSQNMCWHMWPPIKQQKLLLNFCTEVTSLSSGPQPGSWVIGVLASLAVWFRKCTRSLAPNDCGPHPTTHKPMAWYRDHTRWLYTWSGRWEKIKKPTGHLIWLK